MNKYGAKRTGGFASKLENALHELLLLREKCGEIKDIKCQDHVYLTEARILYIPDFKYFDCHSKLDCWAEGKGFESPRWPTIKKLWKFYGPGRLEIYKGSYKHLRLDETITPK